jgi:hypothetical protein
MLCDTFSRNSSPTFALHILQHSIIPEYPTYERQLRKDIETMQQI